MLTLEERQRYVRQIMIKGFGEAGQEKLKQARVLIAGSGGLGSPVAIYLAEAGVGTLCIVDHDQVELSNLNRQFLHWDKDIGRKKTDSSAEKLRQINGNIVVEIVNETINKTNANKLTKGFDVIVDAMDNFPARFLLNSAAIKHKIPLVHGAVYGFEGRVMTIIPGKSACLGCLYHGVPPKEKSPVLGTTAGVIGSIQATEVIKIIAGIGNLLINRLLMYNGLDMKITELGLSRNSNCKYCGN